MSIKVTYLKRKGEYLIVKEDGTSELLKSKEKFDSYIKENDCKVIE